MPPQKPLAAIIIDDEPLGAMRLEKLVRSQPALRCQGVFTDPEEALRHLADSPANVVFTDIEMPGIDGIELGRRLSKAAPGTLIVYVTAYKEYALEAYGNYAFSYLLKPIRESQMEEVVARILARRYESGSQEEMPVKERVQVKTLGSIKICRQDKAIKFRTKKAQEIFLLLIHHEGGSISSDYIAETLWPDTDPDTQKKYLHTHMYYCRKALKALGLNHLVLFKLDDYRIDMEQIRWDYAEFRQLADRWRAEKHDHSSRSSKALAEQLIQLYEGAYLALVDYNWSIERREGAAIFMERLLQEEGQ